MFERFTDRARKVMALANQEAHRFNHESIGTEHILLGLVKEGGGVAVNLLRNLNVDPRKVRLEVEKLIGPASPGAAQKKGFIRKMIKAAVPLEPAAKRVIEAAIGESRGFWHNYVGTEHLLLGLFAVPDGIAARALNAVGLTLTMVREEVLSLLGATEADGSRSEDAAQTQTRPPVLGCPMCEIIASPWAGANPWLITRLPETAVVLGDNQGCPGWCVLLLNEHVEHLAELDVARQKRVFGEVARVAAAIRAVFPTSGRGGEPPRINYKCLGNQTPHVHWHVIPRHADDPDPTRPVWGWSAQRLRGTMSEAERLELVERLRVAINSM